MTETREKQFGKNESYSFSYENITNSLEAMIIYSSNACNECILISYILQTATESWHNKLLGKAIKMIFTSDMLNS